jgi:hypothetical protein
MAGLRRKRLDLAAGVVEVAEVVTEMHGHLHLGPPKTNGRPASGRPAPSGGRGIAGPPGRPVEPDGFVFALSNGGPLRTASFRTRVWRPATRAAGLEGCASMIAAYGGRAVDRRRGRAERGRDPGRAHLGELHLAAGDAE